MQCIFKPPVDDLSPSVSQLATVLTHGFISLAGKSTSSSSSFGTLVVDPSCQPSTSGAFSNHKRDLLSTFHGLSSTEGFVGPAN